MEKDQTTAYPVIPKSRWWELRKKWRQSLPSVVTSKSLAIALNMEERSARLNIYFSLIRLGLIDKEGRPTDFGKDWREDSHYSDVCKQIRQNVYPQDLIDLAPGPSINRDDVERWFRMNAEVGDSAAGKMASVYELLSEADPSKGQETSKVTTKAQTKKSTVKSKVEEAKPLTTSDGGNHNAVIEPISNQTQTVSEVGKLEPSIHIDIQIHISSDASAEQIDQVFASMAKHLYPSRSLSDGQ